MKTLVIGLLAFACGAWSQNLLWDLNNLAWDYGMWFTFVPAIPAMVAIGVLCKRSKGGDPPSHAE